MDKREETLQFLQNLIQTNPQRLKNNIEFPTGEKYPTRHAFVRLQKYVTDFMKGNREQRWVIMPGLRGVGKTTLLSQIYFYCLENYKNMVVPFIRTQFEGN